MKKLITMIVAAAAIAFGARTAAATTYSSVNFDSLTADADYDALYADSQDPEDTSAYYWVDANGALFEASTVIGAVRAYAEASGDNTKYLELDTDAVVQRRAKADGTGTSMGNIFVDTLVQFTPSDEDAECSISATDKIAIWMQEKNIDSSDPELLPVTNLLVCAGAGDVGNAATNYVIDGTWEAGKWYRLVIKSGATAANDNPGFVIFIDGKKIADVNGVEVFPSLITTGAAATTISHLGFNGTGAIDELVFTDEDPCPEVKFFTINWDSNVANIEATYTDGNLKTQVTTNLSAGTTAKLVLPPTGGEISITTTLASGYGFRSTASNCSYANGTITVAASAIEPSFTITPYSENFFVGENSYENFSDAVAAAGSAGGTIRIGKSVAIPYDENDEIPGAIYLDTGTWIIDLAGNTLTGNYDANAQYKATIVNGGCDLLIITNSTAQVGSVVGGTYEFENNTYTGDSLCILGGDTEIYGGIFENIVDVDPEGDEDFTLAIKGGSYGDNGDAASFELEDYVDTSVYQIVDDNGYVVVSPIPNYTVTLPAAPANSTWTVTVGGNTISGVNNVYEVSDGDTLVATLTADEGYLFSDGTTSKVYEFEDINSDINATSLIELPTVAAPKAKIGTTLYLSLQDAIDAVPAAGADYTTITVIGDQTLPSGTKAIVTNKKVDFEAESAVVVTGQLRVVDGSDVIIGQNVTFTSTGHPTVFILGDPAVGTAGSNGASSLVVNGVVANTNPSFDATFAIAGNGTDTLGADITVNGTVSNANGIAIYQAFPGDLVVNGTVTGASAISIKDGSLTVNDGAVVTATLSNGQAYVGNNNGDTPTGDAIIAPYYPAANGYGTPVLDIQGGTITVTDTANCSGIEAYDFNGVTAPDDSKSNVNVSGGTFNTEIAGDYCAEGFVPADDGAGNYGVTYGYTITYVSAQGTAPAAKDVTVGSLGAAYTLVADDLPAMVVAGQVFNGWGKAVGDTISADTTLTAQWATANYTITLPAAAANTSWYVEADGVEVVADAGVYTVAAGADVVVYSKADAGYLFENGSDTKTVYTFEDIAASQDKSADAAPAPAAAKAKIGTVLYLSLNDAVSGAADGDVVELLGNVTIDARVEPNVGANTELTIDLGGYTITRTGTSGNGSAFDVKSGSVVITNGVIDCTQDDTAIAEDGVYAITSRDGSDVTLADLTITVDSECGACAYPFAGSTMTIESGTYANITTTPYRYNLAITGMAVNQPNNSTQNLIINGGSFSQYDPQLGDDSGLMTDFTDDGFVAIQDGSGNWVVQAGYNVTFDANGGTPAPDAQRVAAGGTATAPTAPTKEDYTFNGWKLNDAAYDFGTVLSGDITLVADWTALSYVAENGTTGVKYETVAAALEAAAAGETVTLLADTYERVVATVNNNVTLDINGMTMTSPADDVIVKNGTGTLTIQDTAATPGLVQSTINGVDLGVAVWARQGTVVIKSGVFENNSNYEATVYVSNGAYASIEGGTFRNVATGEYHWKAGWAPINVNVQNGHADKANAINITGGSFSADPGLGDDSLTGDEIFVDPSYIPVLVDGKYVVEDAVTVTFTTTYGTAPDAQKIAKGGTAVEPTAPTYEGYTFNGWKLNDAAYDFNAAVNADITLVADWAAAAVTLNLEGSGTAVDPYLITNLADLQNFRDWVNDGNTGAGQYFKVTAATIDLASETPWTPIGSKEESKYFSGEFDGNGVVINNLSLAASPDYGGFFSAVDGAVLKSFTLGASTITGLANGAAVCAYTRATGGAMFSNVVNNVSITGSKKLGGFVCQANGENTFIDCVNNGAIACTALTDGKIAGGFIAMYNHGDGVKATFLRCVNNGTIGTGGQCAGFIAYNQTTLATGGNDFTSCTNNGAITAQITAGGFSAKGGNSNTMNGDYTFTNCAQLGTLTSVANANNSYNIESSISGAQGTHNAYGKTTVLSAYGLVNHNGIQAQKGWLWKAKIVGETYTTLYSDLATAVADAADETLVIAADSTLSNCFDIDGTVTIGSGIAVSGGNLRVNSGTLAITGGTFTDVALAEAGTGEITITGGTFNADPTDFVADGYEAVEEGGLYTVQLAAPPAGKWDEVEADSIAGLTSENKEAVEATLDKLETALGSVSDVSDWISTVYGSADVPAAKLAATTDALIAISLAYDLPILEGEPTVDVAVTTTTTGKAAFTFTFTDDGDPVSVQAEKALQLIKYSATVNGEFAYTPAKFVVTAVESENGNVLKAEFVGADAAGYGKVDFTVPQN